MSQVISEAQAADNFCGRLSTNGTVDSAPDKERGLKCGGRSPHGQEAINSICGLVWCLLVFLAGCRKTVYVCMCVSVHASE